MKPLSISALFIAMGLAGCMQQPEATRSSMSLQNEVAASGGITDAAQHRLPSGVVALHALYDVQAVNVIVPHTLKVSEANTLVPNADIVWRGDARGDRYQQVDAIVQQAAATATSSMHNGPKVVVDLEITTFHALTERARYTVGGNYNMRFLLTVRDAVTGAILQGPRPIVADTHGSGGEKAMAEEAAGLTQKVVVTNRLVEVLRRELSGRVSVLPNDALVTRFDGSVVALPPVEG